MMEDVVGFLEKVESLNKIKTEVGVEIKKDVTRAFLKFADNMRKEIVGEKGIFPENLIKMFFEIASENIEVLQKDLIIQNENAPGGPFGGPYF
jgi:hypothetical protein